MEESILVSIIVNNYNYERFLPEAIESALNQTYAAIEIIVVDDGSTDGSRDVINRYESSVIPIFQENGKQGKALNAGFARSTGDIVLFLDSDDYLFPDCVQNIVACWNPEIAKIHYRLTVVDTEREALGFSYPPEGMMLASRTARQELLEIGGYTSVPTSGNAYRRKAIEEVFPIPDEYRTTADDYLMILSPFCGEIVGIEAPQGAYRIHTDNQWALASVSGSRFRRFVTHDLQNYALLVQKAKAQGYAIPSDLEQRSLGRLWSRIASLKLEPSEHPVPSDNVFQLMRWGIRTLWHYSDHNPPKKLIYTLWFLWVGLTPTPMAKLAISWLYAPHLRPKPIDWTLTRLRAFMS